MIPSFDNDSLVWLFSTRSSTIKVHHPECSVLKGVTNHKRGLVIIRDEEQKQNLIEREYKLVYCQCCK